MVRHIFERSTISAVALARSAPAPSLIAPSITTTTPTQVLKYTQQRQRPPHLLVDFPRACPCVLVLRACLGKRSVVQVLCPRKFHTILRKETVLMTPGSNALQQVWQKESKTRFYVKSPHLPPALLNTSSRQTVSRRQVQA